MRHSSDDPDGSLDVPEEGSGQGAGWLGALATAGLAGGGAILPVWLGAPLWAGPAAAAALGGGAALFAARRAGHSMVGTYEASIDEVVETLQNLRRGAPTTLIDEVGPPLIVDLVRAANQVRATIEHREQLSHANLMSVEAAFERIHAVLQSLREGVILADAAGRLVLANSAARRLMRTKKKSAEGEEIAGMLPPAMREHVRKGLQTLRRHGADDVQVRGLQVGSRVFDLTMVRARAPRSDQRFGTVIALLDVTRNHEIAKLKEEFISSVSHELRTPLTNICAFAEILAQDGEEGADERREFIDIIGKESQRLRELVDDIFQHSRLQRGEIEWSVEDVDISELLDVAAGQIRAVLEPRRIELEVAATDSGSVDCDRAALLQVLSRLLDNAGKFTPDGGRIRLSATALENDVEIAIDDSGRGIDEADREVVFERFRQMGDHMTDKPTGSGLGLPISRALVDGMHGALWCEASDLGGAKFRVVLPRPAAETVPADPS